MAAGAAVVSTAVFVLPDNAYAATYTVTKTADTADGACDADCSLREAVMAANASAGSDLIQLSSGTYRLTIFNLGGDDDFSVSGDLDVRDSITIRGDGETVTTIDASAVPDRVIETVSGALALDDLTLAGGNGVSAGAGIQHNSTGALTLTNTTVRDNAARSVTADASGGGVEVNATAAVSITDSEISNNDATSTVDSAEGGGIEFARGSLTITRSLIDGNEAWGATRANGGGIDGGYDLISLVDSTVRSNTAHGVAQGSDGGALSHAQGNVAVTGSTVSGNVASSDNLIWVGEGAGLHLSQGSVTVTNSTISGNSSDDTPGVYAGHGSVTLRYATVAGNTGSGAVGTASATLSLTGTIVSGNTEPQCTDPVISGGGNVDSGSSCGLSGSSDRSSTDPMLDPLADNGGATQTRSLGNSSPAIDLAGDCSAYVTTDQRGEARPADGNGDGTSACDAGAYEVPPGGGGGGSTTTTTPPPPPPPPPPPETTTTTTAVTDPTTTTTTTVPSSSPTTTTTRPATADDEVSGREEQALRGSERSRSNAEDHSRDRGRLSLAGDQKLPLAADVETSTGCTGAGVVGGVIGGAIVGLMAMASRWLPLGLARRRREEDDDEDDHAGQAQA